MVEPTTNTDKSGATTKGKKRLIKKVSVLGSGVMGSRIACHFANIGLEVLLLDIVPNEAKDSTNP
ncbi:MAG: 3-hydroxyacyl-CoA dehydrogenase NAD-binding domain-containing protein, partial [Flavobacteriales bacterium]|nr:3-hydroxyacyl-CoA dehydrogenase NAD-binding domain-containing protein [Flavobacteriales bacterium]